MTAPVWTRKATWPEGLMHSMTTEDWLVFRDGVKVGRVYNGAGARSDKWLWVRQDGKYAGGITETYEEARKALIAAVEADR
jgi:hypothetical protein